MCDDDLIEQVDALLNEQHELHCDAEIEAVCDGREYSRLEQAMRDFYMRNLMVEEVLDRALSARRITRNATPSWATLSRLNPTRAAEKS